MNKPEILTKSLALSKICLSLYYSEVNSSLKTVLVSGVPSKISENQITETALLDKDSRSGVMRSKGLQEPTKREAN